MKDSSGFKDHVLKVFTRLKKETDSDEKNLMIPVLDNSGKRVADLRTVTESVLEPSNAKLVEMLAQWRDENNRWFPAQFKVTIDGTRRWIKDQLIDREDRILFWIQTSDHVRFGHVGLNRFDFEARHCQMDNLLRGVAGILPEGMVLAYATLRDWSFSTLRVNGLYAVLYDDNMTSKLVNWACGFREKEKVPLKKVPDGDTVSWEEMADTDTQKPQRYNCLMYMKNPASQP